MSRLGINTGFAPNDGNGDTLLSGAVKINSNFNELYGALGDGDNVNIGLGKTGIYVSPSYSVGLGTTSSSSKLTVNGDVSVSGVVTSNTFSGQVNSGLGTIAALYSSSSTITNLTGTIGTITSLRCTTGIVTTLTSTTGIVTNAYVTNLNANSGTVTNLTVTSSNLSRVVSSSSTITNIVGTSATITTIRGTTGIITSITSVSIASTNISGSIGTITSLNTTNNTSTYFVGTSGTITKLESTEFTTNRLVGTIGTITTLNNTTLNTTTLNSSSVNSSRANITGISTFGSGPVLIGSGTSTGTASQPLQVTGNAYISQRLGIGITNPSASLNSDPNAKLVVRDGNLTIEAVNSPNGPFAVGPYFTINHNAGNDEAYPELSAILLTNDTLSYPNLSFYRAGTVGSAGTICPTEDTPLGGIHFKANTGGNYDYAVEIKAVLETTDATGSGNQGSGYLAFYTRDPNSTSVVLADEPDLNERLRIAGLSGNIGISTQNPTSRLHVVGSANITGITTIGLGSTSTPPLRSQMSFELISNTQLRIKVRGTDGVLRSANITLA